MIVVEGLNKWFGEKQVLHDIHAEFKPGVANLVIGASGGGKSVLIKCMVGLLTPETGRILYDNQDFLGKDYEEKQDIRRKIGMLFQNYALFDSLTVQENIEFPLRMFSHMSASERLDRVNFCLDKVQLSGVNSKYPSEISGGMKKRVGIARAIALEINYLFCDEPNSGLDPLTSRVIDKLLYSITQEFNITTIINSHDMKTVVDMGEHIIFIYQGKKWWEGSHHEISQARKNVPELDNFFKASF